MEGKGKTYTIYRITAPSGKQYVGYTSMSLSERWRNHKRRAANSEAIGHPFYDEIRANNPDDFKIEKLAWTNERLEALQMEQEYIAAVPENLSMNLSSGGLNDASEGGRIFWERLNTDPEKRAAYLKKLSERKKADDWTDYDYLVERGEQWRKENPKEAYRQAYRAIRIANKVNGYTPPSASHTDDRPLKERLMHKYRLNEIRRENSKAAWSNHSEEERNAIGMKISASQKRRYENMDQSEIDASCENARQYVDREKQASAASTGLKKWWAELKADPERYREYMDRRNKSASEATKKYMASLTEDERRQVTQAARDKRLSKYKEANPQ